MSNICSYCGNDLPPTHSGPCPSCDVPGTNHTVEVHDAVHALDSAEVRLEKFEESIQKREVDVTSAVFPGIIESPYPLREIDFVRLTGKITVSMVAVTFFGITAALGIKLFSKYFQGADIETYEWIELIVSTVIFFVTCIPSLNTYWEIKLPTINKIKNHFKEQEESIDEQKKQYGKSS